MQELLKFIKREAESLENSYDGNESRKQQTKTYATAAGLFTPEVKEPCIFCESTDHGTRDCEGQLSIAEKKELLKQKGRCFRCSKQNHTSRFCKVKFVKCGKCDGKHITSMCEPNRKNEINTAAQANVNVLQTVKNNNSVYLQAVRAIAEGISRTLLRVVIDSGSHSSYIKQSVSRKLSLKIIGQQSVQIMPFGTVKRPSPQLFNKVEIILRSQYNNNRVRIEALEVPEICLDVLAVPDLNDIKLKSLELADVSTNNAACIDGISVLIGGDFYWSVITGETKYLSERLCAVNSKFGWTLLGPVNVDNNNVLCSTTSALFSGTLEDRFDTKWLWDTESPKCEQLDNFDMRDLISWNGIRYEASLPWKNGGVIFNDNKAYAVARLKGLTKRLARDPPKLIEYDLTIRKMLTDDIAEIVPKMSVDGKRIYYLPHQPVYRTDKATALRIVFDASASIKESGSLNDHLETGATLSYDILSILLNFRIGKIAMISDIQKAFLQISLNENDRDSHRFLWYTKNPESTHQLPAIQELRMKRVTFGVTCSPCILVSTIQKHLEKCSSEYRRSCQILSKSFYVDDLVLSVDKLNEAEQLYHEACAIFKEGAMSLVKWNSNDMSMKNLFEESECNRVSTQKVLGIIWHTHTDEIAIDILSAFEAIKILNGTKRSILRSIARIYDPLGLLGPFVVKLKILMQIVWKQRLGWDDGLPNESLDIWNNWVAELEVLKDYNIPRCVSSFGIMENQNLQLHIFADASPQAYGAVAFLRSTNAEGETEVTILCSKNRVAPMKTTGSTEITIPKLELTAAVVAARLKRYLLNVLQINFNLVCLWTDSSTTLHWIKDVSKKRKPYISNRVKEIHELTNVDDWRHCDGKSNPADLLTRGIRAKCLIESSLWNNGPSWLREDQGHWPTKIADNSDSAILLLAPQFDGNEEAHTEPTCLLDITIFSTLNRLIRVTAYILRFLTKLKGLSCESSSLTSKEIEEAEKYWIKMTQRIYYEKELKELNRNRKLPCNSTILTLNPFLDSNGILRVKGRLQNCNIEDEIMHPIILPKESRFSQLVVLDIHRRTFHGGTNFILATVRNKFWILRGRQLIKTLIRRCIICRKLHGKAASQPFAPLPIERVKASRAFETVGVDFAGPLYVKAEAQDDSQRKVYIMLLTCAVVRAVHLEIVTDLTAESCIAALRRFVARRGIPNCIMSDNARTFKRADLEIKVLQENLQSDEMKDFISHQHITWKYIAERAAWWGGFWERLVRTVKNSLKAAIGKLLLHYEEMRTLLTEVECLLNSRPLTYITDDVNDLEALTPAHFLHPKASVLASDEHSRKAMTNVRKGILECWKGRQLAFHFFWKRWKAEYLQQLRSVHFTNNNGSSPLKEGDVVLVHADNTPRISWKLGIIQKVFPGRDGKIRACEVRLANGIILRRPIQLLFPLEINQPGAEDVENTERNETKDR